MFSPDRADHDNIIPIRRWCKKVHFVAKDAAGR